MLYSAVLALEFSPVIFESLHWKVPLKIIHGITIPLIIAGITLSTLHQSTLGTMLTIMPYRIHPLWYTPLLPLYFFLIAVAAGLAMVIFESYHSARTYGYRFELKLVSSLARAIPYVLGLYLILKIGELIITGKYIYLLKGDIASILYIFEIIRWSGYSHVDVRRSKDQEHLQWDHLGCLVHHGWIDHQPAQFSPGIHEWGALHPGLVRDRSFHRVDLPGDHLF